MSIVCPRIFSIEQHRQVSAVERRQRQQVHEPDEHGDEREEVQDTAPQSPAEPVWPTAWPIPTTLVGSCVPSLRVGEQQREHAPDPRGTEHPA